MSIDNECICMQFHSSVIGVKDLLATHLFKGIHEKGTAIVKGNVPFS